MNLTMLVRSLLLAVTVVPLASSGGAAVLIPAETFAAPVPLLAAGAPVQLGSHAAPRLADWDGDGDHDLLVGAGDGFVWLFLNVSAGGIPQFSTGIRVRAGAADLRYGAGYTGVCLAEMNGDSAPDLVVAGDDGRVRLYPNGGTRQAPEFRTYSLFTGTAGTFSLPANSRGRIEIGDWDGDGLSDLIAGEFNGYLTFYRNTGTKAAARFGSAGVRFRLNGETLQRAYNTHPRIFDLNQDGILDLAYGINWGHFGFLINGAGPGATDFGVEITAQNTSGSLFIVRDLIADDSIPDFGDLNGDGVMDILTGGLNGRLYVAYGIPRTGPNYRPRVLVDLSHEFTFRYDIFGADAGYWSGTNQITKTSSFRNLSEELLEVHDCLVIQQISMNTKFTEDEVRMVRTWVAAGGGLWLAGNRSSFRGANGSAAYPLDSLAQQFGISFGNQTRQGAYRVVPHELTSGVGGLVLDEGSGSNTLQVIDAAWQPVITDGSGRPVMAVRSWGLGRVLVSAEDAILSNPYQQPTLSNVRLLQNMVRWLSEARVGKRTKPVPVRPLPENKVTVGPFDFYFPGTLTGWPGVEFLQAEAGAVVELMENQLHKVGLQQQIRFVLLASGGGGYSGGAEIGIGAGYSPATMLQVTVHELTHSFDATGGQHPEWMHGWPSLAAIRTARLPRYGGAYRQEGDGEYNSRISAYLSYESVHGLNTLDITEVNRGVGTNAWAIGGKLMWLIERLETQYGTELIPRLYRIKRLYRGDAPCDTSEMVRLFGLAAGTSVYSFFQTSGATVPVNHPVAPVVYVTDPPAADPFTGLRLVNPAPHLAALPVSVRFNSAVQGSSVNQSTVSMTSDIRGVLPLTVTQREASLIQLMPLSGMQAGETLTVRLFPGILGLSGAALDGNGNGAAEGSGDAFTWRFRVVKDAPSLEIAAGPDGPYLTWPMMPSGFSLQSRNDPNLSLPWMPLPEKPVMTHGKWKLRVPADHPSKFFRLSQ